MSWSDIAWLIWTLVGAVLEGYALVTHHKEGTLSWKIWSIFALRPSTPMNWLTASRRIAAAGMLVWFFIHIMSGGSVQIW